MKNLFLLGVLFLSTASFAQSTDVPETPEIIIDNLTGQADGFNIRNGDDKIDFGLIIPTLTKAEVMDFNLSYVLSSETAVIRAAGQRINVPSNLSLPRQSERYIFFNVRINKPEFKLPVTTAEVPTEIVALEGSFPFSSTVDALRADRPLFSVINDFTFKSYSITPVEAPETPISLTVGNNTIEGDATEFSSPLMADPEFVSLGLNMASTMGANGVLRHFPIDVKTLERPELLKSDLASPTTPVVVSIPKTVFDSATEAAKIPFPFTMVWGEAAPSVSLPLAKDFMALSVDDEGAQVINVDFDKVTDVSPVLMAAKFIDADGNVIADASVRGGMFEGITTMSIPAETSRLRVDVYAVDADPVEASIIVENALTDADILNEAKYITRYEEDLN